MLKYIHKTLKPTVFGLQSTQPKLKDNLLHSKYAFVPQCSGKMPICSQMGLLVSQMCSFTLNHSRQLMFFSKKSYNTQINRTRSPSPPMCLTFSNTSRESFKILKSHKQHLLYIKCILHSQIPQVKSFTPQENILRYLG